MTHFNSNDKNYVSRCLKSGISQERNRLETLLYNKLKEFKGRIDIQPVKDANKVMIVFPEGIWTRHNDEADTAIQYFLGLSILCQEIATIKQKLKVIYLKEDIAKL